MRERILLPQPPFETAVDPTVQIWVTGLIALAAIAALAYALIDWRRSGKPIFLLLFFGGGAMMIIEPMIDTVGGCWFPEINAWVVLRAYGRGFPLWFCLVYFVYFGVGVGVVWRLMRRGLTRERLWTLYFAAIAADVVLEVLLLHFGTYLYYGPQPLLFLGFPLWWAAVNALTTMAAGAIVCRYEAHLTDGWRPLQIAPIALSVSMGVNAMVGWPSWLVINTPVDPVFTQLGGVASYGLSLWLMSLVVKAVAAPSGARRAVGGAGGVALV
jgi:hypothetical protein